MDVFLLRHAIAEPWDEAQIDSERALTEEGRARFQAAVLGLEHLDFSFHEVWTSPWRRAIETADLLGPLCPNPPRSEPRLAAPPSGALLRTLQEAEIPTAEEHPRLLLVGHQPWLAQLGIWLATGTLGGVGGLRLRKGGLLWLRGDPVPGGMEVEALLRPSLLRRAGEGST